MSTSPLLINESPLQVLPSLAEEIGLNEAIALQQLHYWVSHNQKQGNPHHFHDGRWWSYNTAEEWKAKNFPFWSVPTIKRTFKNLCDRNLVLTAKLHKDRYNHTKWYTIDYDALNQVWADRANRLDQSDPIRTDQDDPIEGVREIQSSISTETNNPETISQTTTTERPKKKGSSSASASDASLLDLEDGIAEEVAAYVAGCGYFGDDGEIYRYRKTKALVRACEGHDNDSAYKAVMASWEYMESERAKGHTITSAQGVICRALMDGHQPSAEFEAKQQRLSKERREEEQRQAAMDYTRRWLSYAESVGIVQDVDIDEGGHYNYRYHDESLVRNANLWDIPARYAGVTIERLMEALVA